VGTASKTIDTYEYFANYSGKIFDLVDRAPSAAPATISYTDPTGYTGILDKDVGTETNSLVSVTSGSTTSNVTGYKVYTTGDFTSNTNTQSYPLVYSYNSGGYTGNINYVSKGTEYSHTAPGVGESKIVTITIYGNSYESFPETYNYDEGGFTGTIGALGEPTENVIVSGPGPSGGCTICDDSDVMGDPNDSWKRIYRGVVKTTGPDVDYYKHYGIYSGTVSKPTYLAKFNYNADYDGYIYKDIMVPVYRYDQKYIGTLEKSNIAFEYGYERMYEGTIFKNVIEQDIEYTQEYAGEVIRK
jgi:hypothetical protein